MVVDNLANLDFDSGSMLHFHSLNEVPFHIQGLCVLESLKTP